MSTLAVGEVYGRDAELALIRSELERLGEGAGTTLVIEGGAGMGKSRLLAEIAHIARDLGIRVGSSAAEPGERVVELAAMLAALFEGSDPLLDRRELATLRAEPEQRYWLLADLQALLERAALDAPLLVAIDDAQWADNGTAAALRWLPARLAGLPIAWALAVRPSRESTQIVSAFDQLGRQGACRLLLGPLEPEAVAQLSRDLLGGEPSDEVLQLLEEAGGSPFLLVETLLGLQDEGGVHVVDGRAELLDGRLPHRVQDGMRERLGRLSGAAGHVATVAASLGRSFSFGELARTLGWSASRLLGPVDELLDANILIDRGERLGFWHDITREAVRASVPVSARQALDRQAADVLLHGGALPVEVAIQLSASAEPGDEVAITTLLDAALALTTTDPTTAAQFGERALEIAAPAHPRRGEIVAVTAIALHIAGNSDEAIVFADTALRQTFPAQQEAEVRLSIAGMFAISPEVRIAAGRVALSLTEISSTTRARHLACLFHNLVTAGRIDEARAVLDEARTDVAAAADPRAAFTLHVAESAIEYADDRFGPSLEIITAAYREGIFAGDDQRLRLAHMWRGELLSTLDRHTDALAVAQEGLAAAKRDRQGWAHEMFETWRGRLLFRTGQLTDAAAVLEGRFGLEDGSRAAAVLDAAGIVALGRLALHMGDERLVRRLTDVAHVIFETGTPAVQRQAGWLLALFAMADEDATAAVAWLVGRTGASGRSALPRFPLDIADEVHLARIALAAQNDELAGLACENAQRRAALNPEVASILATAAQVRGLLESDAADLEEAVGLFERSGRPLESASAMEDLGATLSSMDRDAGIEVLGKALALYTEVGAAWDARRVRSRLRDLGVRRRIVPVEAETNGWPAMTASELAVARLVAEGLTNREVADRLFISPHTVNSHVRRVFAKLGITSRVELARLASDQERR